MTVNTYIEVGPDEIGGWKVTEHRAGVTRDHGQNTTHIITRTRRKRASVLIGTGAAMVLRCELRVKNRKGQYTTDAASFGNDRRDVKG